MTKEDKQKAFLSMWVFGTVIVFELAAVICAILFKL